jgi:hypothetical protein
MEGKGKRFWISIMRSKHDTNFFFLHVQLYMHGKEGNGEWGWL